MIMGSPAESSTANFGFSASRWAGGVNCTHTRPFAVLLACDTVKSCNIPKSVGFQRRCKRLPVPQPVCRQTAGRDFTHRGLPSIPPPDARGPQREF